MWCVCHYEQGWREEPSDAAQVQSSATGIYDQHAETDEWNDCGCDSIECLIVRHKFGKPRCRPRKCGDSRKPLGADQRNRENRTKHTDRRPGEQGVLHPAEPL
jgi:hypothetical protein